MTPSPKHECLGMKPKKSKGTNQIFQQLPIIEEPEFETWMLPSYRSLVSTLGYSVENLKEPHSKSKNYIPGIGDFPYEYHQNLRLNFIKHKTKYLQVTRHMPTILLPIRTKFFREQGHNQ